MKISVFLMLLSLALSLQALAAASEPQPSLEDQVKALDLENQGPAGITDEKLYSVQERYLPLRHKSEVSLGVGDDLSGNSWLSTEQLEVGYRFHFNDHWSVGAEYATVQNQFTDAANRLITQNGVIPDLPYVSSRADLTAAYNVFYGKFRITSDRVLYFDQYLALGPGLTQLNTGNAVTVVADAGFAFWLGHWGSARLGLKDYYYQEPYPSGSQGVNDLHAHLDLGYLF